MLNDGKMTVLEWLEASTRYSFDKQTFVKIALDRECDPDADVYGNQVTKRQRELMTADIIFTAVLLSPSSTSSLQQKHNGYEKTIGSETDYYQDDKIQYAIRIYNTYGDDRADMLESIASKRKIRQLPIVDVIRL
jgi:hypothetical protein